MTEHFLGNKIFGQEPGNLTWQPATFWKSCLVPGQKKLLPRKCSVIKLCCRELSHQQVTYCRELSWQHNFMTEHFLGNNIRQEQQLQP